MNLYYLANYCYRVYTVARSESCDSFGDEKPQPKLNNLSAHTKNKHSDILNNKGEGSISTSPTSSPIALGYMAASAKLMKDYIAEGLLNPAKFPTKAGFLKHFAAWIIEDDLPFTTGESPGIAHLFKYLQVSHQLPTDTTVRNTLAKIYVELHREVVKELNVCDQNILALAC